MCEAVGCEVYSTSRKARGKVIANFGSFVLKCQTWTWNCRGRKWVRRNMARGAEVIDCWIILHKGRNLKRARPAEKCWVLTDPSCRLPEIYEHLRPFTGLLIVHRRVCGFLGWLWCFMPGIDKNSVWGSHPAGDNELVLGDREKCYIRFHIFFFFFGLPCSNSRRFPSFSG